MKIILSFLSSAILLIPAIAQEHTIVSTHFYAFDYVSGCDSLMVPTGSETCQEMQLSKANIVGPVQVALADGVLTLYEKNPAVTQQAQRKALARVGYPSGLKNALIVLFPAGKGDALPYRALALNHHVQDFPLGVYRVINISPYAVRGAIGKSMIEAKPGSVGNLKPEGQPGAIVATRFEFFFEERWNLLTETRCAIRNDRRWLTCIYQDPSTGRMNIRSIPDRSAAFQP